LKFMRSVRKANYPLWRDFAYEYEQGKLAIESSTAVRYSGIGWTMHARLRRTWIRWLYRMSRLG
jgi:hypothetical protein